MNKHHPLDEAFREQLQGLTVETPTHLWAQIEQKRNRRHRLAVWLGQHKPLALVGVAALAFGAAYGLWSARNPDLSAFPITPSAVVMHVEAIHDVKVAKAAVLGDEGAAAVLPSSTALLAEVSAPSSPAALQTLPAEPLSGQTTLEEALLIMPVEKAVADQAAAVAMPTAGLSATEFSPTVAPQKEAALPLLPAVYEGEGPGKKLGLFAIEPKCAEFGNGFWSFHLDLIASPDLAFNELQARDANYEDYAKSRQDTESRLYAFSSGLRLSVVGDNGLAFRTGVNYSQVTEKFTYFNGFEEDIRIETIRDNQGNIIGTDTIVVIGERYKVTRNVYEMVDIPFLLGYEFRGQRLNVSVNAGVYLNLMFRQRGDFLSPQDLTPVSFDSSDPEAFPAFKRQAGLGYYGSFGLAYKLRPGLSLLVEPHFKIFPKSVTQENYALMQRPMSAGVFLGVRKQL